jgi:hypothetical protein
MRSSATRDQRRILRAAALTWLSGAIGLASLEFGQAPFDRADDLPDGLLHLRALAKDGGPDSFFDVGLNNCLADLALALVLLRLADASSGLCLLCLLGCLCVAPVRRHPVGNLHEDALVYGHVTALMNAIALGSRKVQEIGHLSLIPILSVWSVAIVGFAMVPPLAIGCGALSM